MKYITTIIFATAIIAVAIGSNKHLNSAVQKPAPQAVSLQEESIANQTSTSVISQPASARNKRTTSVDASKEAETDEAIEISNQDKIIDQAVQLFPLNDSDEIELNDHSKNYLNQIYNALASRNRDSRSNEATLAELQSQLEKQLPDKVSTEASALVGNYFAYRQAEQKILVPELSGEDLKAYFLQTKQLRRAYLGEEIAQLLFNQEEQMTHYIIDSQIVQSDDTLSREEKQERMNQLQVAYNEVSGINKRNKTNKELNARE
ncbi:lipase secretion chaperone [Halioxenophilus aromaticivorans]|uniref:Lipase chaperone n=1 Tax=Halioxenophilus aromaticivorans TaxID=1306992 RepID=A0AAV3U176_9ALTE